MDNNLEKKNKINDFMNFYHKINSKLKSSNGSIKELIKMNEFLLNKREIGLNISDDLSNFVPAISIPNYTNPFSNLDSPLDTKITLLSDFSSDSNNSIISGGAKMRPPIPPGGININSLKLDKTNFINLKNEIKELHDQNQELKNTIEQNKILLKENDELRNTIDIIENDNQYKSLLKENHELKENFVTLNKNATDAVKELKIDNQKKKFQIKEIQNILDNLINSK